MIRASIISIGNSQGIIIPARLLRQLNLSFKSSVQVEIDNGTIIIKPEPRTGWAEAALQMQVEKDDELLLNDTPTEFEKEDWKW